MKLYKNVDIKDIESICKNGILPASVCKNYNWENDNRGAGSLDVVYLAKYIGDLNTAVQYGLALVEVEIEEDKVKENALTPYDVNADLYEEYICDEVPANKITAIYVPEVVKEFIEIPKSVEEKITWCKMTAVCYDENDKLAEMTEQKLRKFMSEVQEFTSSGFNYLRAYTPENTVDDIYKVRYIF